MIIMLKITCFGIWLFIMYLIITAVFRKQRIPVKGFKSNISEKANESSSPAVREKKLKIL